jgi:hypothetical protein
VPGGTVFPALTPWETTSPFLAWLERCFLIAPTLQPAFLIAFSAEACVLPTTLGTLHLRAPPPLLAELVNPGSGLVASRFPGEFAGA